MPAILAARVLAARTRGRPRPDPVRYPRGMEARPFHQRALGIRPEDERPLAWLGGANFVVNVGGELAWGALMGRFVAEAGPKALPAMYMAVSAGSAAAFLGLAFVAGGAGSTRRLVGWILAASAAFVALAAAPASGAPGLAFAALLAAWIYQVLYEPELLGWAGSQVPLQAAKRITPAVAACGALGRVGGALLATDPLRLGSVSGLLVLAAILNATTVAVMAGFLATGGSPGAPAPAPDPAPEPPARPGLPAVVDLVRTTPLFVRLASVAFLVGLVAGVTDYPRTVLAARAFPTPERLAAFFGAVGALTNLATVVLQLFGTGLLVRRLGLEATLGILPAIMGLLAAAGCAGPGFLLAAGTRVTHLVLSRGCHAPAALLLLNAAPSGLAARVRAVAFGCAGSLGLLAAGLGLRLAGQPRLESVYAVMLVVCFLAGRAVRGIGSAYRDALAAELHRRAEGGEAGGPEIPDVEARVLLASGDPRLIEAVRRAAAEAGDGPLGPALVRVLDQGSEEVALLALERTASSWLSGPLARRVGERLLASPDPAVRRRAIASIATLGDGAHAGPLGGRLGAGGLEVDERAHLAGALLRVAVHPGELRRAVAVLKAELSAAEAARRRAALLVLGRLGHPVFVEDLVRGLADPDPTVAGEAARALGRARMPAAVPALEACRATARDPELARQVEAALARIRDQALDRVLGLLEVFAERDRRRLRRAIEGLDLGADGELLARALGLEPPGLRAAVVGALRGAAAEGRVEALRVALGGDGTLDPVALVRVMLERPGAADGPLERVLAALPAPARAAALVGALREHPLVGRDRDAVARAVHLAGIAAGSAAAFDEAFALAGSEDKGVASRALELIEAGIAEPELRRTIVRAVRG